MKYEIEFNPGDDDRLPTWMVVDTENHYKIIERFYGQHEKSRSDAQAYADELNTQYEEMLYALENEQWQRDQDEMNELI
jgi:hypothetical protein